MLLREAVFLSPAAPPCASSDPAGRGRHCRLLGARHGKCVYRVTVQTRQGSYDFAVNLNHALTRDQVRRRDALARALRRKPGARPARQGLRGLLRPDEDLWSEEFVPGETLDRAMKRISRQPTSRSASPSCCRSSPGVLYRHTSTPNRTGKRWEISDPSMSNVIVPTHDYQTGARIVSVSSRKPHAGLIDMMRSFREGFVARCGA